MSITAEEARRITEENKRAPDISRAIEAIDAGIEISARLGESQVRAEDTVKSPGNFLARKQFWTHTDLILKHYRGLGYRIDQEGLEFGMVIIRW